MRDFYLAGAVNAEEGGGTQTGDGRKVDDGAPLSVLHPLQEHPSHHSDSAAVDVDVVPHLVVGHLLNVHRIRQNQANIVH
jgi:hypothetical protein